MNPLCVRLDSFLTGLPAVSGYCLAYSGGLDSSVLLDALCRSGARNRLRAIHINHQLQGAADGWADHCRQRCRYYGVPLQVISVNAGAAPGESPEAAARQARYQALAQHLHADECLLSAQHQNDQAETLLLQLLRGSGPAGLAAMPEIVRFAGGWLARPWLQHGRAAILHYAEAHQLPWVEDASNQRLDYDRNYLRARLIPLLLERWPGAIKTLARSANLQAQASALLDQLGEEDLHLKQCPRNPGALSVQRLLSQQTAGRMRNTLRYWISRHGLATPSAAQLEQIVEALSARPDSTPVVNWPGGSVGRYQDSLYAFANLAPLPAEKWSWNPEQALVIPAIGLELKTGDLEQIGLVLTAVKQPLTVGFRRGGERILLPGRPHRHQLKKLLQEREVPPWLRERLPLLFHGDELIAVLGLEPAIIAESWQQRIEAKPAGDQQQLI
jgi:tRNA(Ile)-lysidine synthase